MGLARAGPKPAGERNVAKERARRNPNGIMPA
jgi:hypothetical protein